MEKFGKFADKSTGISPFKTTYLRPTALTVFFHFFLGLLKAVTILPVLLFGIFSYPLTAAYKVYLDIILAYFFNVQDVDVSVDGVKRSDIAKLEELRPGKSDIVFFNSTSPLDKLILQMISKSPKSISLAIVDRVGALRLVPNWGSGFSNWCFGGSIEIPSEWVKIESPSNANDDDQLETFKAHLNKLIGDNTLYVIPEGTITNNRGLLSFPAGFNVAGSFSNGCKKIGRNIKTCTIKLSIMGNLGTVLPIGKFWWYYLNFGSMTMDSKVKIIISTIDEANITNEIIKSKLSNNGRLKLLSKDLTIESKIDYIKAIKEKKYL